MHLHCIKWRDIIFRIHSMCISFIRTVPLKHTHTHTYTHTHTHTHIFQSNSYVLPALCHQLSNKTHYVWVEELEIQWWNDCVASFEKDTVPWEKDPRKQISNFRAFPGGSVDKQWNAGNSGLIPRSGRSSGKEMGNPLQSSCLENLMDWGAWWATVHKVAELDTTEATEHAHA